MKILYATPHKNIGIHDWRRVVARTIDAQTSSYFEYRRSAFRYANAVPAGSWKHQSEWPTYDVLDRPYCGLPKRIMEVSAAHKSEIWQYLNTPQPTNPAPA